MHARDRQKAETRYRPRLEQLKQRIAESFEADAGAFLSRTRPANLDPGEPTVAEGASWVIAHHPEWASAMAPKPPPVCHKKPLRSSDPAPFKAHS